MTTLYDTMTTARAAIEDARRQAAGSSYTDTGDIWTLLDRLDQTLGLALVTHDARTADAERWRASTVALIQSGDGPADPRCGALLVRLFLQKGLAILSDTGLAALADAYQTELSKSPDQ